MKIWEQHLAKHIMLGKEALAKGKKLPKESRLAAEGLRSVTFVWPSKEWHEFIDTFCKDKKPGDAAFEVLMDALKREMSK